MVSGRLNLPKWASAQQEMLQPRSHRLSRARVSIPVRAGSAQNAVASLRFRMICAFVAEIVFAGPRSAATLMVLPPPSPTRPIRGSGKGRDMWKLVLQRLAILLVMLFTVSIAAFAVPLMNDSDPARTILLSRTSDPNLDAAAVQALRAELGLNRPLAAQYLNWLGNALTGDLGYSFASRQPVAHEIGRALSVSLTLALTALGWALVISLPLGTLAAMKPGSWVDGFTTLLIQTLVATPEYWFAPVSILVFALWLGALPSAGWQGWSSVVLPALTLALRPMAYFTQITRAAMLDVLQAPYITAARARGLTRNQSVLRHGLRNGSLPVVTFFALWFAGLLGGSVVVEVIFAVPGMGRLLYNAVTDNDVPVLQGAFVAMVGLAVVINTAADILYVIINPAMRGSHA